MVGYNFTPHTQENPPSPEYEKNSGAERFLARYHPSGDNIPVKALKGILQRKDEDDNVLVFGFAEKLALIEAGFEYVSGDPDGTQYFRKRKR